MRLERAAAEEAALVVGVAHRAVGAQDEHVRRVGGLVGAGELEVVARGPARLPDEGVAVDHRAGDGDEAGPRRHDDLVAVLERQLGQAPRRS
jgi:hypothetical protein